MKKLLNLSKQGNALKIQMNQLDKGGDKLAEIDSILADLDKKQDKNFEETQDLISQMKDMLGSYDSTYTPSEDEISKFRNELMSSYVGNEGDVVSTVDHIALEQMSDWDSYMELVEEYGSRNHIDLSDDPFSSLMSRSQIVELQKKINEEFTYKNSKCDKYDYFIAITSGAITGLIDVFFVGTPGQGELGKFTDEQAANVTEKFAEMLGWDKNKAIDKGSNLHASAVGFLENNFKINYDQATTHATKGAVNNLSLKNHHLKSLGHSPDIIGLFFSVLNQFTNTSSFISNGQLITIETDTFDLQGHNFIAKVFSGIANWFGHLLSDWSGSSGTIGNSGRGTGVPIPFYNLLQLFDIGSFGQHKQTFATISTKVFESGYDFRHGLSMSIPVLINELTIRLIYTIKAKFYHKRDWQDSLPKGSNPELRRMLLVGHGTLCLIDGGDAYIRSGGATNIVDFMLRINIIAWVRFGNLCLKELHTWYNAGHIDAELVDEYLNNEYRRMIM